MKIKSRYKPGDKFNLLTITEIYKEKSKSLRCFAVCECGTVKEFSLKCVTSGQIKSCSCLRKRGRRPRKPRIRKPVVQENAKERNSWIKMKERCYYPRHRAYKYYGERGIQVCEEWRNSFKQFLEDMGKAPTRQHSIDRINNDGNYCKENCRWATPREQNQNRRDSRFVTILGETRTISHWARVFGKPDHVISKRLSRGWPPLEAVLIPKGEHLRPLTTIEILSAYL